MDSKQLTKIFVVLRVSGIKYYKPFATLEEAEEFILSKHDKTTNINDFMKRNFPSVFYGIDHKSFYIFKSSTSIRATSSFDQTCKWASAMTKKMDYHIWKYTDFQKTKVYPLHINVKCNDYNQTQEYHRVYERCSSIIEQSPYDLRLVAKNDPNSLLDYCYNTMLANCEVIVLCKTLDYIHFSKGINIGYSNDKIGLCGDDFKGDHRKLNLGENKQVMDIIGSTLDSYLNGHSIEINVKLTKLNKIMKGFAI